MWLSEQYLTFFLSTHPRYQGFKAWHSHDQAYLHGHCTPVLRIVYVTAIVHWNVERLEEEEEAALLEIRSPTLCSYQGQHLSHSRLLSCISNNLTDSSVSLGHIPGQRCSLSEGPQGQLGLSLVQFVSVPPVLLLFLSWQSLQPLCERRATCSAISVPLLWVQSFLFISLLLVKPPKRTWYPDDASSEPNALIKLLIQNCIAADCACAKSVLLQSLCFP